MKILSIHELLFIELYLLNYVSNPMKIMKQFYEKKIILIYWQFNKRNIISFQK